MPSGLFSRRQHLQAVTSGIWSDSRPISVDYLVVAGGGGGGYIGGGGGGGGLLQGNLPVAAGAAITVTVGAGGGSAVSGSNSVFGSITSTGGGSGGGYATTVGGSGGSGGGGNTYESGNINAPGQGTAGQGNAGGQAAQPNGVSYQAGGGGGAGTVGLNAISGGPAGNGGAGVASDISGSRVTYAGGGGGAADSGGIAGNGGAGGAGAGGASRGSSGGSGSVNGANGAANTGGGGGGFGVGGTGGSGGSGIVIVSYPDIYAAAASTTGLPTVSTSGSGSISFSGSGQYLQYPDSTAFTMGNGDFTVEAWVYLTGTGRRFITAQSDSGGADSSSSFSFYVNSGGNLQGAVTSGSTIYNAIAATSFPTSTWTHVALTRDGNTLRLYRDGVQAATANVTGVTVNDSSSRVGVGSLGEYVALSLWQGNITNLRIVKGTCLYPSGTTFTPSTAPLTAVSGTSILLPAVSGAYTADISSNGFSPSAFAGPPTWSSLSPFATGLGYKNRVYQWTSSGSITF